MQSVLKTVLAVALGLGFLILDSHAKPSVAFLGLSRDSDPQVSDAIAQRIQWELSADTAVTAFAREDVDMLYAKGALRGPEVAPKDMPGLSKLMGAQYYAYGRLEPIAMEAKRTWWKPWAVNVKWTQGLRLRILNGANGETVFDGLVSGEFADKGFLKGPESRWGRMSPLERETWLRKMALAVSLESAKAISKTLKEKEGAAAGGPEPKTEGG
jgi:hypothetical protein